MVTAPQTPVEVSGRSSLPSAMHGLRTAVIRSMQSPFTVVAVIVITLSILAAIAPQIFTSYDPTAAQPQDGLLPLGSPGHLLGTDQIGRDVLARILYGARLAWIVGLSVAAGSLLIGGALGAVGGYAGGWFDGAISRVIDGILAFPPILLALVLAAVMTPSTRTAAVALVIVYTPFAARVMRSSVIQEMQLDYVSAARGIGLRGYRTLLRHVLPNTLPAMLVVGALIVSRAIVVEASLSFLGVGTQPPTASWGLMVADGRNMILNAPRLVVMPALALCITVMAINFFSDAIGNVLDVGGDTLQPGLIRGARR